MTLASCLSCSSLCLSGWYSMHSRQYTCFNLTPLPQERLTHQYMPYVFCWRSLRHLAYLVHFCVCQGDTACTAGNIFVTIQPPSPRKGWLTIICLLYFVEDDFSILFILFISMFVRVIQHTQPAICLLQFIGWSLKWIVKVCQLTQSLCIHGIGTTW